MAYPRLLITGAGGNLGQDLRAFLARHPHFKAFALNRQQLDLSVSESQIRAVLNDIQPDVIINTAAFTGVDAAETHFDEAMQVNCHGPLVLAQWCEENNAYLVHISTDYVFDGSKGAPYTPADMTNPIGRYGMSKEAGELAVLTTHPQGSAVVRTSWLFGSGQKNFVPWVIRSLQSKTPINVADDQWGTPTWTLNLCDMLLQVIRERPSGVLHGTGTGRVSRLEQALYIAHFMQADASLISAVPTAYFNLPATRPVDTSMQSSFPMAMTWKESLAAFWKASLALANPDKVGADV